MYESNNFLILLSVQKSIVVGDMRFFSSGMYWGFNRFNNEDFRTPIGISSIYRRVTRRLCKKNEKAILNIKISRSFQDKR